MAKIIVTSTANSVKAAMNDYFTSGVLQTNSGIWRKSMINFKLHSTYIVADIVGEVSWKLSHSEDLANDILQIDSVDSNEPSDLNDLFARLSALIE